MLTSEWILASTSQRRIDLLKSIGLVFEVIPADIEELRLPLLNDTVDKVAVINARRKVQYVASKYSDAYVIGADTIVTLDEKVFNKPKDIEEAYEMLSRLSGRTHEVITAVCVMQKSENFICEFAEVSRVHFQPLTHSFIEEYTQEVAVLDKAGAYAIQDPKTQTFASFDPESYPNIMGFPIKSFQKHLECILLK